MPFAARAPRVVQSSVPGVAPAHGATRPRVVPGVPRQMKLTPQSSYGTATSNGSLFFECDCGVLVNYAASARMCLRRPIAREWSCDMRGSLTPSISPRSLNFMPRK